MNNINDWKDTIIKTGTGVLLDGLKLGTASVIGEFLSLQTRKLLNMKKDNDEDEIPRTKRDIAALLDED